MQDLSGADLFSKSSDGLTLKALLLLLALCSLSLSMGKSLAQTSQKYLETLQDEASGLTLDKSTESEVKPVSPPTSGNPLTANPGGQSGAIEEFAAGLSMQQFEELLKHNYIGSYLFYKRLGQPHKDEVYRYYQQNPDPNQVRQKILQIKKSL